MLVCMHSGSYMNKYSFTALILVLPAAAESGLDLHLLTKSVRSHCLGTEAPCIAINFMY